jgi:hypothetical protein
MIRLRGGIVFTIGATIGALNAFFPAVWPLPLTIALLVLCPGSIILAPVAGHLMFGGLQFALFLIAAYAAVANGLTYVAVWFLFRMGLEKRNNPALRRAALTLAIVSVGAWTAFSVSSVVASLPDALPPAIATQSRLAGRWEGDYRNGRLEMSAVLICRPRVDGTLDGVLYLGGRREGELYAGTYRGDSLAFIARRALYRARRNGDRMTVEALGRNEVFGVIELHHAGTDTHDE